MDRRAFLVGTGAVLLVTPIAANAQKSGKVPHIGFLSLRSGPTERDEAFRIQLRELGYLEGQNIVTEYRWANGRTDRLPDLARELVGLGVDVIVATGTQPSAAAKHTTNTIPIVMAGVADPVASGLVASLVRPGGNLTGPSTFAAEITAKRLELLKELLPRITKVAVLLNPDNLTSLPQLRQAEEAAREMRIQLQVFEAYGASDLAPRFRAMPSGAGIGLLVFADPILFNERGRILEFATSRSLPAIYAFTEYARAGGLMSYSTSNEENYRNAARYVDKILRGTKPSDLPIEQATRFELVINLKTAKALGLTIPPSLLQRADEVIE